MLSPLLCQKQPLPFKFLILEFESHQIIKTGFWSNPVGLTQLEEYNLPPYIYSYVILFNLTLSVCFCLAGHAQQLAYLCAVGGRDCWGIEQGQGRLSFQVHCIKGPSARPSWNVVVKRLREQMRNRSSSLPFPSVGENSAFWGGKDGGAWNTVFFARLTARKVGRPVLAEPWQRVFSIPVSSD